MAKTKNKREILNISSELFEAMALEACKKNGINKVDSIATSFERLKMFDEEGNEDPTTQTRFYCYITISGQMFTGVAIHPVLAIEEAITKRNLAAGALLINTQTTVPNEQDTNKA